MSNTFEMGTVLRSVKDQEIRIDCLCSEGGLGAVYDVTVNGEKKLFRWLKACPDGRALAGFWESTREKMERGAPGKFVFWPEDLTDYSENGFGYVTRPDMRDNVSFREVLTGRYGFPSWRETINVAMNLALAFYQLHQAGYCFGEHCGDFRFSTRNGSVLFPETEEIIPMDSTRNAASKPRYCAPELLMGTAAPGTGTDRYAMGVYLFCLFCRCHPLEGMRHLVPILTPEVEESLYAKTPLFLFDREDDANRPHPVIHRGAAAAWNGLPDYIQALFFRLFDQQGLQNPDGRPGEEEWIRNLCRMKADRILCGCGNEVLGGGKEGCTCIHCGKPLPRAARLVLPEYAIPVAKGRKIYRCQLGECDPRRMLDTVACVVEDEQRPGLLRLKNVTGAVWNAYTPSGTLKTVRQEESVPVNPGITIYVDGAALRIEKG